VDSSGPKDVQVKSYSPDGTNVPHGMTHCRHLANTIEPFVYGGDALYVKLLSPPVIFGHAHLHSRTDSLALRAEYRIVGIPQNPAV